MEDGAGKYIEMFENSGAKSFLRKIKNFGTNKELVLMTRESSECAKAAKRCFGFDRYISNITKLKNNGTIGHIEIIMKKPERKLELLQKELEKNGLELGDAVIISDNPEDPPLFKEKVGLFITYKDRNGELNISDYREFERKLIGSD
jgi:phosphoserine phosphatase